jgi:hypothetical protein
MGNPDYLEALLASQAMERLEIYLRNGRHLRDVPLDTLRTLILLVPDERIELPTNGLQNRCSTAELIRPVPLGHFSFYHSKAMRRRLLPICYPSA